MEVYKLKELQAKLDFPEWKLRVVCGYLGVEKVSGTYYISSKILEKLIELRHIFDEHI